MNDQNYIQKSPGLAGFLSILPGAGQAYVGHYVAGFTNIAVIGSVISILEAGVARDVEPFFGLFMAFFWVFNIVDAVRRAQAYNQRVRGGAEMPTTTDSPLVGGIILTFLGLILTLDITFNIRLDWLEDAWPLFLLGGGIFLLFRYHRMRGELRGRGALAGSYTRDRVPTVPTPPVPPGRSDEDSSS